MMAASSTSQREVALLPGFSDPVGETQSAFRAVLDAIARPGSLQSLPVPQGVPDGWPPAAVSLALTLLDQETPVWLDPAAATAEASAYLRFHCGCPRIADAGNAMFAVVLDGANMPPLHTFSIGDPLSPERSATLILVLEALTDGPQLILSGPGIKGERAIAPVGLSADFVQQWTDNHALYPSGIDVILVAGDAVVGLPRSVAIEAMGS
jgi:alpha-D-ribose 1-methylphosphonate 5-triphosphate synthase subunit PhnH